ncbi:hypothetical protein ACFQO4_20585 [Saliphagus sp. GCM10025334]
MTNQTRREFNANAATALAFMGWFNSESDNPGVSDLGFFDTHLVANDGEGITIDPELMDFVGAIEAVETDDGVEIRLNEDQLEIDGLTNPLTETFDAAGQDIDNVGSLNTGEAVVNASDYADLQAAIDDLPVAPGNDWAIVDAQDSGVTYDGPITLEPHHPPVKIIGATDGSGNPDTTIDGLQSGPIISQEGSRLRLENLKLENAETRHVLLNQSYCLYYNCTAGVGYNDRPIQVNYQSSCILRGTTTIEGEGTGSRLAIGVVNGSLSVRYATVKGGTQRVIEANDGGHIMGHPDSKVTAGSDVAKIGIRAYQGSDCKWVGEIADVDTGVFAGQHGMIEVNSSTTYTNVSEKYDTDTTGFIYDADLSEPFYNPEIKNATNTYLSTDQTVADLSETKIQFDSVALDELDGFDTANNEFTASKEGSYLVSATIQLDGVSGSGRGLLKINRNGSSRRQNSSAITGSGGRDSATVTGVVSLADGDTVNITLQQDTGGDVTVDGVQQASYLDITRLG